MVKDHSTSQSDLLTSEGLLAGELNYLRVETHAHNFLLLTATLLLLYITVRPTDAFPKTIISCYV